MNLIICNLVDAIRFNRQRYLEIPEGLNAIDHAILEFSLMLGLQDNTK